jgi:formylglycine-generating enzyme required for sulfatase activity
MKKKRSKLKSKRGTGTDVPHTAAPARTPPRWRAVALIAFAVAACAVLAVAASGVLSTRSKPAPQIVQGDGVKGPKAMLWVPGGEFLMGSDHKLAQPNERPAHRVKVGAFWMDRHHVTNAEFRRFVQATGYVTTAEKKPSKQAVAKTVYWYTCSPLRFHSSSKCVASESERGLTPIRMPPSLMPCS